MKLKPIAGASRVPVAIVNEIAGFPVAATANAGNPAVERYNSWLPLLQCRVAFSI